jgi:hypothetical protein
MRMRAFCSVLAIFVVAANCGRAWAGREKALGYVVAANNSYLDDETAMAGANIYPCDVLETDNYGSLQAQFAGSQIVLSPSSTVVLAGRPQEVRVIIIHGVTTFSASSAAALIVETPAGTLREPSGSAYSGTVSITGPTELVLSAVRGAIGIDTAGGLRTVSAGESARITFDRPADESCHESGYVRAVRDRRKIGFYLIGGAAAGAAGYFTWSELTESPTTIKQK